MAYNSSTSSLNSTSSSTSESSAYSSPCSSPSSLPPPLSPYVCKLSVPFLWEEKPGITKPTPSPPPSSSLKPKNLFYGTSLDLPPLPPPPCLSHAPLLGSSQPTRSREKKPLNAGSQYSFISRRPPEVIKEKQQEDPFLLALKACTKVDKRDDSRALDRATSFNGLPSAFSVFKPTKKDGECKKRNPKKDSGLYHQARREERQELSSNGSLDNGRAKSVAISKAHGALHDLLSQEVKASRDEATRGPNLYTLMDEESSTQRAHHYMYAGGGGKASISGCVSVANMGKQDDSMQLGLHVKESARKGEHFVGAAAGANASGWHSKSNANGREVSEDAGAYIKHKHKDAMVKLRDAEAKAKVKAKVKDKANYKGIDNIDALDIISMKQQGHSRVKHGAHHVQFTHCGGSYMKIGENSVDKHVHHHHHHHHSSKLYMLSDMLGCKTLPPVNGAAIHPSLHFHDKLFSRSR